MLFLLKRRARTEVRALSECNLLCIFDGESVRL